MFKGKYFKKALNTADKAVRSGVKKADNAVNSTGQKGSATVKQPAGSGNSFKDTAIKKAGDIYKTGDKTIKDGFKGVKKIALRESDVDALEKLAIMWQNGALTDEEFKIAKDKLLGRI